MVRSAQTWSPPVRLSPRLSGPVRIGEVLPVVLAQYALEAAARDRTSPEKVSRKAWRFARESLAELEKAMS
jgi:hypothetical protein